MSRTTSITCIEGLPRQAGVLMAYHAEIVLELIDNRGSNNADECERLYAELELIESAIAAIEAGTR